MPSRDSVASRSKGQPASCSSDPGGALTGPRVHRPRHARALVGPCVVNRRTVTLRLFVVGFVAAFAATLTSLVVAPAPALAAGSWPVDISALGSVQLYSHGNGNVTALNCSQHGGGSSVAVQSWNSSGRSLGSIPIPPTVSEVLGDCGYQPHPTSKDGRIYLYNFNNDTGENSIVAIKNGQRLWEFPVSGYCSGRMGDVGEIAVSTTTLYALVRTQCAGSTQYRHEILGIRLSDHTQTFRKDLGLYEISPNGTHILLYQSGIVVRLNEFTSPIRFRYLSRAGVESTAKARQLQLSGSEHFGDWTLAYDGTVTAYITRPGSTCSGGSDVTKRVVRLKPGSANAIFNIDAECFVSNGIRPMPDGRTILMRSGPSDQEQGTDSRQFLTITETGGLTYFSAPMPQASEVDFYGGRQFEVDGNGNVIFVRSLVQTEGDGDQYINVDVLAPDGHLKSRSSTELSSLNGQRDGLVPSGNLAISNGALYVDAYIPSTGGDRLVKFDLPGIGMDYPRNRILNVTPPSSSELEYVALGDSFSSGEGVEEGATLFIPPSDTNGCHRSLSAYPMLLNQDATLNLNLSPENFRACSGATTQAVRDGRNGEPGQLDSVSSATDVITITVGGNDVNFGDFVRTCLQPDTGGCAEGTQVYNSTMFAIDNLLPSSLADLYAAIQSRLTAGNSAASVYVVGYPFVVRAGDESCSVLDQLGTDEQQAAELVTVALNRSILEAVANLSDPRFKYVDPLQSTSPFEGHDMCGPDPYFINFCFCQNPDYTAHPNRRGQEAYAQLIRAAM